MWHIAMLDVGQRKEEMEELMMERVMEPMERNDYLLTDRNFEIEDYFEWKLGNLAVMVELGNSSARGSVDYQWLHSGMTVAVVAAVNTNCIDCM